MAHTHTPSTQSPNTLHTGTHTCACTHTYTQTKAFTGKHTHLHTLIPMCVQTHMFRHTHMHRYTHRHPHTHPHSYSHKFFPKRSNSSNIFFPKPSNSSNIFFLNLSWNKFSSWKGFFFFKFRQDVLHSEGRRERERTWPLWTLVTAFKGKEEILGVVFKYHLSSSVYKAFHVSGSFLKTQKNSVNLISLAYSLWPHWFHPITGQEMSSQQRCIQLNWAGFSGWVKALFLNNCKIKCFPVFHLHQKKIK